MKEETEYWFIYETKESYTTIGKLKSLFSKRYIKTITDENPVITIKLNELQNIRYFDENIYSFLLKKSYIFKMKDEDAALAIKLAPENLIVPSKRKTVKLKYCLTVTPKTKSILNRSENVIIPIINSIKKNDDVIEMNQRFLIEKICSRYSLSFNRNQLLTTRFDNYEFSKFNEALIKRNTSNEFVDKIDKLNENTFNEMNKLLDQYFNKKKQLEDNLYNTRKEYISYLLAEDFNIGIKL